MHWSVMRWQKLWWRVWIQTLWTEKAAVADVSPASITHDVKGTASSGNPDADAEAAFGQFVAANLQPTGAVWLMSSTNALALSMRKNALGQKRIPGHDPAGRDLPGAAGDCLPVCG